MDEKIKDKFSSIGNFNLEVISAVEVVTETERISHVKFIINFEDGTSSNEITLPLNGSKGIGKIDWYDLDQRLILYQKPDTARQKLVNIIRSVLPNVPKKVQHQVSQLGTHIIEGEPIFNTGKSLIRNKPTAPSDIKSKYNRI